MMRNIHGFILNMQLSYFENIDDNAHAVREAYYETGALIIKNLLPVNDLKKVARFLEKILLLRYPSLSINAQHEEVDAANSALLKAMTIDPEAQSIAYDAMARSVVTHSLSCHSNILNVIETLLSKTFSLHEKKILLMSPPRETWHLANWHQDYYYNGGPENACTVYAPLQNTSLLNGGLSIALGSHLQGTIPHEKVSKNNKWNTIPETEKARFKNIVNIEMDAGDVLFLHSLVPHTANVNKSEKVRFVANFRYQDLTNPAFMENNWRVGELVEARTALRRRNA